MNTTITEMAKTFLITAACRAGLFREREPAESEPEPEHVESDWRLVAKVDSETTLWERA